MAAYTYSSALVTTLRATIEPNLLLMNNTTERESLRKIMYALITALCVEFSAVTSEAD